MMIEVTDKVYERLAARASGFETPNDVIKRLLDKTPSTDEVHSLAISPAKPEIHFIPHNEAEFKSQLLKKRKA